MKSHQSLLCLQQSPLSSLCLMGIQVCSEVSAPSLILQALGLHLQGHTSLIVRGTLYVSKCGTLSSCDCHSGPTSLAHLAAACLAQACVCYRQQKGIMNLGLSACKCRWMHTVTTKLNTCAADNDKQDTNTNGTSDHQHPPRAPEPLPRQQAETELPSPPAQSPASSAPTDATATVELAVKLRSLVLSISTDSVCVALRMMERLQQYQQHAHLWQGRPQVSDHSVV